MKRALSQSARVGAHLTPWLTALAGALLCIHAQAAAPQHTTVLPAAAGAPSCSADIQGQPGKKFNMTEISVSQRCTSFTVNLVHTGKKPWQQAGHDWVLVRTADIDAVIADGLRAGPDHAWLQTGDARIIAATQMLSGGEHASVTFPVDRLRKGEDYTYFCSFPSHALPMRGHLVVVD
jgi:azurin